MRRALTLVLTGVAYLAVPCRDAVAQSARLQPALDLYASAAYEEALTALDAVSGLDLTTDDHVVLAQHRMLCLMAIGRIAAAENAAAQLLAVRPDFTLATRDASPRVRALFDATRRRVLPGVARELFTAARRLYDAGERSEARAVFSSVVQALGDAAIVAADPALADLRALADGFVVLTSAGAASPTPAPGVAPAPSPDVPRTPDPAPDVPPVASRTALGDEPASLVAFPSDSAVAWRGGAGQPRTLAEPLEESAPVAPAPSVSAPAAIVPSVAVPANEVQDESGGAPPPVEPTPVVSAPTHSTSRSRAMPPPAPRSAPPPPPPAGAPFAPIDIFTYDWRDKDVTPPVPIAQAVSGWWGRIGEPAAGTPLGAIEVVVDESGHVVESRIYSSVNRVYDAVLLESAKHWRYEPATRGGRAVRYRRITGVVSGR